MEDERRRHIETYTSCLVAHGVAAVLLIFLGMILCMFGKRFPKLFLIISGLLAGGLASFLIIFAADVEAPLGSKYDILILYATPLAGVACAGLSLLFRRIGSLGVAFCAGTMLSLSFYYIPSARTTLQPFPPVAFVPLVTACAVLLMYFFDFFFSILFSAITGASAIVVGIDMFVHTGLNPRMLGFLEDPKEELVVTQRMQVLLNVFAVLIGVSILSQTLIYVRLNRKRRKKNSFQCSEGGEEQKSTEVVYAKVDSNV